MRVFPALVVLLVSGVAWAQVPSDYFEHRRRVHEGLTGERFIQSLPASTDVALPFNPAKAEYFERIAEELQLTSEERASYESAGLVSVDHQQAYSFASSYYAIYARELPVLITSDSILHAIHRSYSSILKNIERTVLVPGIESVLKSARTAAPKLNVSKQAKSDADDYFAVALTLLSVSPSKVSVSERAANWLSAIEGNKMIGTEMWGRVRTVDFSQFKPRGHYTESPELTRYFRAMMWLGRVDIGFRLDSRREIESALAISAALKEAGTLETLSRYDELLGWIVGRSDNLGPVPLLFAQQKYPKLETLAIKLKEEGAGAQKIRSQFVESNVNEKKQVKPPPMFQLFGQRYLIDSFILSKVVFDSIIFNNKKVLRMMPSGLDVMAAFGNDEAVRLLGAQMEQLPYAANLQAARDFVAAHPQAFWRSSFVNVWSDALRTLDDPKHHFIHMPKVMHTEAWRRKQLQTQLASWAELRHDTILYAKQSYTAFPSCEYPKAYVEPYPEFYARIKFYADAGRANLTRLTRGLVGADQLKPVDQHFQKVAEIAARLESLAYKELAAREFTSEEEDWLAKTIDIRGGGSGPPRYDGWYVDLFFDRFDSVDAKPVVADVHTDPESQTVLEVGVGNATFLVAAIDNEDDLTAYVGPISTYYEFEQPMTGRLTDEVWRQQLYQADKTPSRPVWIAPLQPKANKRHLAHKRR